MYTESDGGGGVEEMSEAEDKKKDCNLFADCWNRNGCVGYQSDEVAEFYFLAGLKAGREEHPAFKQYPCTRDCNRLMRWNTNLGLWQCPVHNKKVKP